MSEVNDDQVEEVYEAITDVLDQGRYTHFDIRRWTCSECGAQHSRDRNAAINIARLGRQTLAAEAVGSPSPLGRGDFTELNKLCK